MEYVDIFLATLIHYHHRTTTQEPVFYARCVCVRVHRREVCCVVDHLVNEAYTLWPQHKHELITSIIRSTVVSDVYAISFLAPKRTTTLSFTQPTNQPTKHHQGAAVVVVVVQLLLLLHV